MSFCFCVFFFFFIYSIHVGCVDWNVYFDNCAWLVNLFPSSFYSVFFLLHFLASLDLLRLISFVVVGCCCCIFYLNSIGFTCKWIVANSQIYLFVPHFMLKISCNCCCCFTRLFLYCFPILYWILFNKDINCFGYFKFSFCYSICIHFKLFCVKIFGIP